MKQDNEITSMNFEWDNESKTIISYLNAEHFYPSTYTKENYEIIEIEGIKEPEIGMSEEEVLNSTWGEPEDINKTTIRYGTSEQWCYSWDKYIYFEDGIVTAIQE